MRTLEEFNGIYEKQNKTCFIIAAGTSIASQNLEPLRDHLTIAVNSGYVAVSWANFFVTDDWSVSRWSYYFKDLRENTKTIPLLYEDKLLKLSSMLGDSSRCVFFRHRKGLYFPRRYDHEDTDYHLGQTRTSTGSAMMIARIMGCDKIVLLGVDNCRQLGFRYFWQMPDFPHKPHRNDGVRVDRYKKVRGRRDKTDDDLMDIEKDWAPFCKAISRKCKVYNASDISILDVFPKVKLEDCL